MTWQKRLAELRKKKQADKTIQADAQRIERELPKIGNTGRVAVMVRQRRRNNVNQPDVGDKIKLKGTKDTAIVLGVRQRGPLPTRYLVGWMDENKGWGLLYKWEFDLVTEES